MHPKFSEWFLEANPDPGSELIALRWSAIDFLISQASLGLLRDAVKMAYRLPLANQTNRTAFGAAFQEGDKAFLIDNNDVEYAVLAASLLADIMRQDLPHGLLVSLLVACISLKGRRKSENAPWLANIAEQYLCSRAASLRKMAHKEASPLPQCDADHTLEGIDELVAASKWGESVKLLSAATIATTRNLNEVALAANAAIQEFRLKQRLFEEESDILWWLISEHTREHSIPFSTLEDRVAALIAGKELADFVRVLPGPMAIPAFLGSVVAKAQSKATTAHTLQGSINALDASCRTAYINGIDLASLDIFCPLHLAITKSLESKQWGEAFTHVIFVESRIEFTPADIGHQFFRERLLLRLVSDTSEV